MDQRSFMCACARAATVAVTLFTAVNNATAATISVPAGGDLQAALDAARPGDTILLASGATYSGNFTLPVHGGTTYVTIRTAGNDSLLPAAGVRITPAHATYLAKLRAPVPCDLPCETWMPALRTAPGAAYWRVMLVEFLGKQDGAGDVVKLGDGTSVQNALSLVPHHLTFDRVYMHGDPLMGQKRGIALNSGDTTIINSHVAEMKAVGQDSQAIGGWNGPGPFQIENNHLEAAGNVFLMGGSDPHIPGLVPEDLLFRRNTLTRPVSWRSPIMPIPAGASATAGTGGTLVAGTYAYRVVARRPAGASTATSTRSAEVTATVGAGGRVTIRWNAVSNATEYRVYGRTPGGQTMYWTVQTTSFTDTGAAGTGGTAPSTGTVWQVKNLFELKNFRGAQVDFNLMENNWAQAQSGVAVLLTVRNQSGGCPQCVVEDVTFEYNIVRNIGAGFTILGEDYNYPSQQTNNIRIRNNEFSGMDSTVWGGNGYFVKISEGPRDLTIDHNTIISPSGSGLVSVSGPAVQGFVFTNNVGRHNSYGIQGTGYGYGNTAIAQYLPNSVIRRNVFAGGSASRYPADNFFPTTTQFAAHFVDYAAANYALIPGTDWEDACTSGLHDLGADYGVLRPPIGPPTVVTQSLPDATELEAYSATLAASGGRTPYQWSISSGSLPAGITLNSLTGVLSGVASVDGTFTFTVRVTDANGATATRTLTLRVNAATASNGSPVVTLSASPSGVVPVGVSVTITAKATDSDGTITRVNFFLNGQAAGSDTSTPFRLTWLARSGGPFSFTATAVDDDGASTTSAALTVQTTAEIVIYAADVQRTVGDYQLVSDTTAAAGYRMLNPDRGAVKILTASASPASYVEFTFYAEAGRPYRLWIRGKGHVNHWANDSAFLQFSQTVDAAGAPTSRIGTTGAMWYSVEEYNGAGISYWGWQDNGFGLNVAGPSLYFAQTGLQTLRIQKREDGLSIDQIVISPSQYFSVAPGLPKNDATIVAKP
jgi:hypothetical protein